MVRMICVEISVPGHFLNEGTSKTSHRPDVATCGNIVKNDDSNDSNSK